LPGRAGGEAKILRTAAQQATNTMISDTKAPINDHAGWAMVKISAIIAMPTTAATAVITAIARNALAASRISRGMT
jgi:hypothetical protein